MSVTPPPLPAAIKDWEVLDLLASLVQKSLVVYEEDEQGRGRYRLLEPMRQYARDRLLESGEADSAREQHLGWYLGLAERAEPGLKGRDQVVWRECLDAEQENLRQALAWVLEGPGVRQDAAGGARSLSQGAALRLAGLLDRDWRACGRYGEGWETLEHALARGTDVLPRERAKALQWAGSLLTHLGQTQRGRELLEESLALWRSLVDKPGIAEALNLLCFPLYLQRDYGAQRAAGEESLGISREIGDRWNVAQALHNIGNAAQMRGNYETARPFFEESVTIQREIGDARSIAYSLGGLADVLRNRGDYARALALFEETRALHQVVGDDFVESSDCMHQGDVLLEMGDFAAARTRYEDGLALRRARENTWRIAWALLQVGHAAWLQGEAAVTQSHAAEALRLFQPNAGERGAPAPVPTATSPNAPTQFREGEGEEGTLSALESLAVAALMQGLKERAARLAGAAAALREVLGRPGEEWWRRPRERMEGEARAACLDQEFAAAWAEGRTMTLRQAVEYALQPGGTSADE